MAIPVIAGILALACSSGCGLAAGLVNLSTVDKVNKKLPKEDQFAALGWYWSRTRRLHREYKRLYPAGRLILAVNLLTAIMFACLVTCAWGFGLFS
jgi:hypothetical protein